MQKIIDGKTEIIIDGDTVTVNGEVFVKKQVAEPEEVHPFLKDVPKAGADAYWITTRGIGNDKCCAAQLEIDRGTVSLNREALVEKDNRRVAETALKKWIGENNIPVATEEQMADADIWKYAMGFDYLDNTVRACGWKNHRPIGDIHFLSRDDFLKVRDNCDALIRTAYGWPEVK